MVVTRSTSTVKGRPMIKRFYKPGSKFVYVKFSGIINNTHIHEHIKAFNEETAGRSGLLELADTRTVGSIEGMTVGGLMESGKMEQNQSRTEGGKLSIVVASQLNFGMSRAFSAIVEKHRTGASVFYDLYEAVSWLNCEEGIEEILVFLNSITEND